MIKINYRYYRPIAVIRTPSFRCFVRAAVVSIFEDTGFRFIDVSIGNQKHRPVKALVFPEIVWERRAKEEIEVRRNPCPEGNVPKRRKGDWLQ